jgi:hypothetical protein
VAVALPPQGQLRNVCSAAVMLKHNLRLSVEAADEECENRKSGLNTVGVLPAARERLRGVF